MGIVNCPYCHTPGARKFLWKVRCPKKGCQNYDPSVVPPPPKVLTGNFNPGANGVTIRYRNRAGEEKNFTGDRTTLKRRRNHLSLCLVPTGQRCNFDRSRILNLQEIERCLPAEQRLNLTAKERQIIGYHRLHGTTSPMLQAIARKLA